MIVQNPHKSLRVKSKEIPLNKIKSLEIKAIIKEMKKELAGSLNRDGVALAAPQIGRNLRIFIVFKDLIDISKGKEASDLFNKNILPEDILKKNNFAVFINPKIIKKSKKNMIVSEGCLSVLGTQGKIKRAEKVTIEAFGEEGEKFTMSAANILSQAIQHEIDHLDGTLFIDKAEEIKKIN